MLRASRKSIVSTEIIFALALAVSTLAAQGVTTNSMPGTDFSRFHTYKWVAIKGAAYPNQIVDQQIQDSIDSQLATKGLTKTDDDRPTHQVAVISNNNGTPMVLAALAGAGEAEWPQPRVRPSM